MNNRREHRRGETSVSVEVFEGRDLRLGVALDLSRGGVGLALDHPLSAESIVSLSLFLVEEGIEDERTPPVTVRGRVIWCNQDAVTGFRAGIRLLSLTPPSQARLEHFVERLA